MIRCRSIVFTLAVVCLTNDTIPVKANDTPVDFSRSIRPLLADKCFQCHGHDEDSRMTEMRLDTQDGLVAEVESGERCVVPGDPSASEMYQRLTSDDADFHMPPEDSKKTVAPEQIELIRRWIAQGAKWKQHWAFVAPKRPALPTVRNVKWVRNPIDRFILARLEAENMTPAEQADKTTLIRRVTYDLTGLPPTLAEVDAFLKDESPDAYERLIDRLLASPHYGEHMACYWLDAARYGDTHGLHLDNVRQIWPYREWVINAFNQNMPFDEFTIEQLAGDLLPNPTEAQKIATGFNRCNVTTSEGGALPEEYAVHYAVDRVSTMSTVWMGLTMGCSVCHDHKFDPIGMKDFYQLFAFYNSLNGPVMDGNKPLPAPVLKVPNPAHRPRLKQLAAEIASLQKQLNNRKSAVTDDVTRWADDHKAKGNASLLPSAGLIAHWSLDRIEQNAIPPAIDSLPAGQIHGGITSIAGKIGQAIEVSGDGYAVLGDVARFDRTAALSYGAWIKPKPGNSGGAVIARMDSGHQYRGYDLYIAGDRAIAHIINTWPNNAIKVETKAKLKADAWQHVLVTYDGSSKAAGVRIYIDGKSSGLTVRNDALNATIQTDVPLQIGRRSAGSPYRGGVDDIRMYDRALSQAEAESLAGNFQINQIIAKNAASRTQKERLQLLQYYLTNQDEPYQQFTAKLANAKREQNRLQTDGEMATLIWEDVPEPKPAHILIRGQYDQPGDLVQRNTPAVLPPLPVSPERQPPTRLTLAKWLLSPEHPLTTRVVVNRFWQQYFGVGLVKTSEDFGSQGTPPSHPDLLDWLAVEFRTNAWDIKRFQKLIVMSATYRQSSVTTPEKQEQDPENQWLARGPRFRLDAEEIRDTALAVSGLLVPKIGGPSVRPYQPAGIWEAVGYTDSNTAKFTRDTGEALYRRSLYTFWKRTAPPPSMTAFDAPSRETCTVRRSRTNTPQAALTLMNDEQFVEASRVLAQRMLKEGGKTDRDRAAFAFRLATARWPTDTETAVLLKVQHKSLEHFKSDPNAAKALIEVGESKPAPECNVVELAAWTMVGNLVLNLDEVITKE